MQLQQWRAPSIAARRGRGQEVYSSCSAVGAAPSTRTSRLGPPQLPISKGTQEESRDINCKAQVTKTKPAAPPGTPPPWSFRRPHGGGGGHFQQAGDFEAVSPGRNCETHLPQGRATAGHRGRHRHAGRGQGPQVPATGGGTGRIQANSHAGHGASPLACSGMPSSTHLHLPSQGLTHSRQAYRH